MMLYDRTQGSRLLYTTWGGPYWSSPIEPLRSRIVTGSRRASDYCSVGTWGGWHAVWRRSTWWQYKGSTKQQERERILAYTVLAWLITSFYDRLIGAEGKKKWVKVGKRKNQWSQVRIKYVWLGFVSNLLVYLIIGELWVYILNHKHFIRPLYSRISSRRHT